MMRVTHVVNSIDLRSGGPIYALRATIEHQLSLGYHVSVITTDMQAGEGGYSRTQFLDTIKNDELWVRIPVEIARAFGRGRPWNHLGFSPWASSRVSLWIREHHPHIVHIHGVFAWISSVACRQCWAGRIPYIMEPYGVYDHKCFRSHLWPLKVAYHYCFTLRELHRCARIRVASNQEGMPFRKSARLNRKVAVIPYGVVIPDDSIDQRYSSEMSPTVVYLSRITKKKRPEWVVLACERVRNSYPNLRLVIAGSDDGHLSALNRIVQQNSRGEWVSVLGFAAGEEKRQLLQRASVFVLPSRDESLGAVVLEAMAHGVPVVVTPGVAAHEYVDAAACGLTVEDSIEAVAEGIRKVLQSDRDELGRRGRAYVAEHLTWPAIVERLDELYRNVLRQGSHSQSAPRVTTSCDG